MYGTLLQRGELIAHLMGAYRVTSDRKGPRLRDDGTQSLRIERLGEGLRRATGAPLGDLPEAWCDILGRLEDCPYPGKRLN